MMSRVERVVAVVTALVVAVGVLTASAATIAARRYSMRTGEDHVYVGVAVAWAAVIAVAVVGALAVTILRRRRR